jgi:hypothetical protein
MVARQANGAVGPPPPPPLFRVARVVARRRRWSGPSLAAAGGVWQRWRCRLVRSGRWWSLEGVRRPDLVAQRSDVVPDDIPRWSGDYAEGVGNLGCLGLSPSPFRF